MDLCSDQLQNFHLFLDFDPGSFVVKYRTIVWCSRSPCSWWYVDYLDNFVQDAPVLSLSRTQVLPRSSRWRRSQTHRLTVDDQVFVVRSGRLAQDGQHGSWISSKLWCDNLVPMGFFVVSAAGFPALKLEFTSDFITCELDAVFSFESLATSFPVLVRSKFELCALSVPKLWHALAVSGGYQKRKKPWRLFFFLEVGGREICLFLFFLLLFVFDFVLFSFYIFFINFLFVVFFFYFLDFLCAQKKGKYISKKRKQPKNRKNKMKRNASKRDERPGRSRHLTDQSFGVRKVNLATPKVATRFRPALDVATKRSSSPPCFPSFVCLFDMARRSSIWLNKSNKKTSSCS